MSPTVILATRSAGKLRELTALCAALNTPVLTLDDAKIAVSPEEDALEDFDTFEANALAKARWFHARRPDSIVIADDSGLTVDALHGDPGVRSKRWSGRVDLEDAALDAANNAQLQRRLDGAAREGRISRRAQYVCAAAFIWATGEYAVRAETHGVILRSPVGVGGFGYDPYFLSDDLGATFAEVGRAEKAAVSHRGRAFTRLLDELQRLGAIDLCRAVDPRSSSG